MHPPTRTTADLSGYPDLVVIYLGMRMNSLRGLKTMISFGPKIRAAVAERPDGLLLHENLVFSAFPPHAGMRQYWRDFDSLERWARSLPHPGVVATVPAQPRWHRFLARDVLPRRTGRVGVHRHAAARPDEVRPRRARAWLTVLRSPPPRAVDIGRDAVRRRRGRALSM